MSLYVIATPIGNDEDITMRALRLLKTCPIVIGEEHKETRRLLRRLDIHLPQIEVLNEHSSKEDIQNLVKLCQNQDVALISDCGTPGFCDPGADLVQYCRSQNIAVFSVPGPSSLMSLLSVCGHRLDQFYFRGFLPAKTELREKAWIDLKKETTPILLMDTPYRLSKTLDELSQHFAKHKCVLGLNLSTDQEIVAEAFPEELKQRFSGQKAEFVLLLLGPSTCVYGPFL